MTRSQLINELLLRMPHLMPRDVENIIDLFFEEISVALISGRRVEFRGFGAFSVKPRRPRIGRNPRNGMQVEVPMRYFPRFRAGKNLRERLNAPTNAPATPKKLGKEQT